MITILSCVCPVSISALARMITRPRPVRYASRTPLTPYIYPPVGKSGALTKFINSSTVISGLSIYASHASITSTRLCGGILVAIPTAIPDAPFTRRFGIRVGITLGSTNVLSKLGSKSTVSLYRSSIIASPNLLRRASV